MKLNEAEMDLFPNQFAITQKIFEHYYDIGFKDKNLDSLNEAQKVLCYHFICDGLIDNSGFYSILLETQGEFNTGYSKSLELVADLADKQIFDEIVSIYKKYEKWFLIAENPPALDDDSKEFDINLCDRIDDLQMKWNDNMKMRENLFKEYLSNHKHLLVEKE